ncbi:LPXTG-motif cell wall-anchored protein [Natronobacillus azotifigens]|uniref:Carbohydrate binding domain-containing protein n=1 Tax=Natronobacillus azotifigens TaxID=472978 RepID=A0A9J6RG30_9BACI|nr:carbohydrate binding domain-containing protein [Natronobacillus azotifigens]MCZ0704291.1 carbohydrate binding domain-containing protein [Natronobacillus azotifigens]
MKLKKAFIVLLAVLLVSSNFSFIGSVSASESSNANPRAGVDRSSNPEDNGWNLTFSDEFDGDEINMDNWSFDEPTNGRWNDEVQSYTEDNAWVEDGNLIIEARKEDITEPDGQVYNYSSSKLWTKDKKMLTYGRVDVRAKLPEGQGMWPAIWMMPNDEPFYGTWPVSGEIDIMELLGHEPHKVHGAIHYGEPKGAREATYTLENGTFADDYHVFSIEWEPGEIRWYVDDVLFHTANDWFTKHPDNADEYTYPAPFDQPFMLILNISVGGGWPGNPDESTVFPQQMKVDYVRFYEKDEYPVHEKPESAGEVRAPLEDGNYVYNGDFASTDYWTFSKADGGNADFEVNNGALDVKIESGGTSEHAVQVLQAPIHLEQGATYRASFSAKAEDERPVKVKIGGDGDAGWADYAGKDPITISTEWDEYEFEFKMGNSTDVKARYEFNMGQSDIDISFSDVRLEKIADPDPADMIRGPLPTGNYIYNGTFDQGEGRMGFWEFQTDETADATYYIGSAINERRFDALITDGGNDVNSVQLTQSDFRLENGREYELTFDASAEAERDVQVAFTNSDAEVVYEETISLSTETKQHTVQFTMEAEGDNNSILQFNLGGNNNDVYIDNVFLERLPLGVEVGNLLENGIFDSLSGWRREAYNPAKATFSEEDGQAKVSITNIGDADWNIQLFQTGVEIEQGETYEVSFDAKSTLDRPLRVQVQRNGEEDDIWTGYSDQTVTLTEELQTFTYSFEMSEPTDLSSKFGFALGKDDEGLTPEEAHDVFIDNVSVRKVEDPTDPEENIIEVESGTKTPVSSNEVVKLKDTKTSIKMPANLPEGATISIEPVEEPVQNKDRKPAGDVIKVDLQGAEGATGFVLELGYEEGYDDVAIFYYNEDTEEWELVGGDMNPETNTISLTVDHFSTYGVFEIDPETIVEELLNRINDLENRINELENNDDVKELEKLVEQLQNEIEELKASHSDLGDQVSHLETLINELNSKIEELQAQLPDSPEEPENRNGEGGEVESNDEETAEGVDSEETAKDGTKGEGELPSTATNVFNYLLAGMLLLTIGGVSFIIKRKKLG